MVVAARFMVLIGALMGAATIAGLTSLEWQRPAWRVPFALTLLLLSIAVAVAEAAYLLWRYRAAMGGGDTMASLWPVLAVMSAPGFVSGALCADMFLRS